MNYPQTYYRPTSLEQALKYQQENDALAVAGGALVFGSLDLPYETVVDLQGVRELRQIDADSSGVTLGSAVTLQEAVESDQVGLLFTNALTRAIPLNLRHGATVGESLMVRQPPREWLAALVASDAAVTRLLPTGERVTDGVASLMDGSADHVLQQGILASLFIPSLAPREAVGAGYVARTPADEPIVNAAAFVQTDEQRRVVSAFVAICGASVEPVVSLYLDTLAGSPLDDANIASAVKAVAARVNPVGDYLGSAEYRREMARVTAQRALLQCGLLLA